MFHLALYDAAIAVSATLTQVAAIADPIIAPSGSGFLVPPTISQIMRLAGVGAILNRFQMTSASIRKYAPFECYPVNLATSISSPARALHFESNPIPLAVNEELDAFVSNSSATSTHTTVAVWFCDGPITPVKSGRPFSLHWTASATLVANAWTSTAITFDNAPPSGTFAIVGSRCSSAGALFHRWIQRGGSPYRPGTFAQQALGDYGLDMDRYGGLGTWMTFANTTPPQVEIFSRSADTSEEGILDLIQVG